MVAEGTAIGSVGWLGGETGLVVVLVVLVDTLLALGTLVVLTAVLALLHQVVVERVHCDHLLALHALPRHFALSGQVLVVHQVVSELPPRHPTQLTLLLVFSIV